MTKKLITQCSHCKDWFEPKMIGGENIADMVLSGVVQLSGNREQCPHCGKMTLIENSTLKAI